METRDYQSWGRLFRSPQVRQVFYSSVQSIVDVPNTTGYLPYGNGRSYGDCCLNPGGVALETRQMDRFIQFDANSGRVRCEAGMLLSDIISGLLPKGWFPIVTPGTQYVTVGGALANDVHGKNHHRVGSFGRTVTAFELLRSDGQRLTCTPDENADFYAATLGGLGLTGLITWIEFLLRPIVSNVIESESIRFSHIRDFFRLTAESDQAFEYTVAWVDCTQAGSRLGRGIFIRGNHSNDDNKNINSGRLRVAVPFPLPISLVNRVSLRLFNEAYYHLHGARVKRQALPLIQFFYPLDKITHWNRLYGPRGFYQYQCVVPEHASEDAIVDILRVIGASGCGSMLAVLKKFGALPSPGMLSFPMPGITFALDFPNKRKGLSTLLRNLDAIVTSAGGRLYPAKDARMPGEMFRAGYPQWERFQQFIDPQFSSAFWRRVSDSAK